MEQSIYYIELSEPSDEHDLFATPTVIGESQSFDSIDAAFCELSSFEWPILIDETYWRRYMSEKGAVDVRVIELFESGAGLIEMR